MCTLCGNGLDAPPPSLCVPVHSYNVVCVCVCEWFGRPWHAAAVLTKLYDDLKPDIVKAITGNVEEEE